MAHLWLSKTHVASHYDLRQKESSLRCCALTDADISKVASSTAVSQPMILYACIFHHASYVFHTSYLSSINQS
jgi:hypothetical protein